MKTKQFKMPISVREEDKVCTKDCKTCQFWVGEDCRIDDVEPAPPALTKASIGEDFRNIGWTEGEDMSSNMELSPSHPDGGMPDLGGLDRQISQSNVHFAQFNGEGGRANGASRIRRLITQLDPLFVPGWKPALFLRTRVLTENEMREDLEYYNLVLEDEALLQAKEDAMDHVEEAFNESIHDPMNPEEELLEMPKEEEEPRFYNSDSPWAMVFEVVPRNILEVWTAYPKWEILTPDRATKTCFGMELMVRMTPRPKPEAEMTHEELVKHNRTQQRKLFEIMLPDGCNPVAGLNRFINKNKGLTMRHEYLLKQALRDAYKDPMFGTGALRTAWVERSGQIPKFGTHQRLGNRRMQVGSYYSKFTGLVRLGYYTTKDEEGNEVKNPIVFDNMKTWVTWALKAERITKYEAKCLWNLWKGELKLAKLFRNKEAALLARELECPERSEGEQEVVLS